MIDCASCPDRDGIALYLRPTKNNRTAPIAGESTECLSIPLARLTAISTFSAGENLITKEALKSYSLRSTGRYAEHFLRGQNVLLRQAHCIRVRPMLEPDRDRTGKSHHAPQLRVVPEQPTVTVQWNDLADAGNEAAYCSAWLSLQCASIAGVTAGLVVVRQADKASPAVTASWPARSLDAFRRAVQASGARFPGAAHHRLPAPRLPRRRWYPAVPGRPSGRDAARGRGTDHSCCRRQAGRLARLRSSGYRTGRRAAPLGRWLARILTFGASLGSFLCGMWREPWHAWTCWPRSRSSRGCWA